MHSSLTLSWKYPRTTGRKGVKIFSGGQDFLLLGNLQLLSCRKATTCVPGMFPCPRLQILKHKEMVEKCHGDGVTTCRICNRDFSHKRSHHPEPIQFCNDCQMVNPKKLKIDESDGMYSI